MDKFNDVRCYVLKMQEELNNNYKNIMSDYDVSCLLEKFENCDDSYDEIVSKIDEIKENIVINFLSKCNNQKKFIDDVLEHSKYYNYKKDFFGYTLNYQLVNLFELYEDISVLNIDYSDKCLEFEKSKSNYFESLSKRGIEVFDNVLSMDYDNIEKSYNKIISDVDTISTDSEVLPNNILNNDISLLNGDGSLNDKMFDFSNAEAVYDFAKKHNKLLIYPNLISNDIDVLEKNIDNIPIEDRREYTLNFLDDYMDVVRRWAKKNDYKFDYIGVINGLVSDKQESSACLKNNFWVKTIGKDYKNKINYVIDMYTLARKNFPSSKLIYSENNEFLKVKSLKIKKFIEYLRKVEISNKNYVLDGICFKYNDSNINIDDISEKETFEAMKNFIELGIPMYRTIDLSGKRDNDVINSIMIFDRVCNVAGVVFNNNVTPSSYYDEYLKLYSKVKQNELFDSIEKEDKKLIKK